jgi:putative polyhydroxyalkanoate system protein
MADISMKRKHDFDDLEGVRSRIEGLADKFSERMGGTWCWKGDEAVCEARGAEARVGYDEDSISIDVSLPLMLRPLRKKLESKIEEYYARYFEQSIGES